MCWGRFGESLGGRLWEVLGIGGVRGGHWGGLLGCVLRKQPTHKPMLRDPKNLAKSKFLFRGVAQTKSQKPEDPI